MNKEIDHNCTDEIVCPYCGYEHSNSWEYNSDSSKIDCEECGKEFCYDRDYTVTYCTSKVE